MDCCVYLCVCDAGERSDILVCSVRVGVYMEWMWGWAVVVYVYVCAWVMVALVGRCVFSV